MKTYKKSYNTDNQRHDDAADNIAAALTLVESILTWVLPKIFFILFALHINNQPLIKNVWVCIESLDNSIHKVLDTSLEHAGGATLNPASVEAIALNNNLIYFMDLQTEKANYTVHFDFRIIMMVLLLRIVNQITKNRPKNVPVRECPLLPDSNQSQKES